MIEIKSKINPVMSEPLMSSEPAFFYIERNTKIVGPNTAGSHNTNN
jgi:hypothetical protein